MKIFLFQLHLLLFLWAQVFVSLLRNQLLNTTKAFIRKINAPYLLDSDLELY